MSERTPTAFMTSLGLHGLVVGVMFLVAYSASFDTKVETKPFILVAGEGDNFGATEAPALGTPGGIKLNIPTPPTPAPEPPKPEVVKVEPKPVEPEPAPVPVKEVPPEPKPTPAPVVPPTKSDTKSGAPTKTKTIAEEARWKAIVAESKIKQKVAREKAAEQKRLDQEKKEAAKRAALAAANAPRVDAEGIASGVKGGSASNKTGGAGGTALTRPDGPVLDAYFGMLRERLLKALDKPPGLSDTLVATAEFRINADGSLTAVKIIGPSGSAEFDRAVIEAFSHVRMPARPDGKSSTESLRFRTKDLEGG